MNIFLFILIFSTRIALLSLVYKKKFILSLIICLERILLNLLIFNFIILVFKGKRCINSLSIFILTMSAIEGSLGISILTLISRKFNTNRIKTLKTLKK